MPRASARERGKSASIESHPAASGATDAAPGSSSRTLVWILLAGGVLRAALVAWFHGEPLYIDDERSYASIAWHLATTGEFAFAPGQLTSLRPPLYPGLVAVVYAICGVENYTAVRVLQAVLSLLTVVIVHRMAQTAFDERTANLAAAAMAFYPSLAITTNLLLTETLFTLLVVCFSWTVQRYFATSSLRWALGAGIVLGLGALTRSVLWLFPPVLTLFVLLSTRSGLAWWQRLGHASAACLAFAVVLAPWTIRNSRLQETFVTVDVMGGRNVMMGNYEFTPLYRAWDAIGVTGPQSWDNVLAAERPAGQRLTQGQIDKQALRRALTFMLDNPMLTMQRSAIKFLNFWQLEREWVAGASRGYWKLGDKIGVLCLAGLIVGAYVAAMWLGLFGFACVRPADPRWKWFVACLIGFVCLLHTVAFGHSRYHLPLMPLILVFSAAAAVHWRGIWHRRGPAFWLAATGCTGLVAGWVWEIVAVDADRLRALI